MTPGEKPSSNLTDAAARLGAYNDAKFMDAYTKAGGTPDLKRFAEIILRKR